MHPCKNCIVLAPCKIRFKRFIFMKDTSVINFAHDDCKLLDEYLYDATQEEINEVRIFFGLEPYK